jgi:hypothetical protein
VGSETTAVAAPSSPFPKLSAATERALAPAGIDQALCLQLLVLVEREPEVVAEQVRAWLREDAA